MIRCSMVDMNAFFASIEQKDNPAFHNKPIGVTNGNTGTCIITCSYEARAQGIHTGMRVKEAKRICPGFIQIPARPERYVEISMAIMKAMEDITPDVEVFSMDEAFLDITRCQHYWNTTPENIGNMIKEQVWRAAGVPCSVGLSGDKTTAKYAAKLHKPDGLTLIPPWEAKERLSNVPVMELCGVNTGIAAYLAQRGAFTCGDVAQLPISVLGKRFGNPGRRIWKMCRGEDPAKVETNVKVPQSIGHGKVMPPDTRDKDMIYMYLIHMAEKVGQRLRQHALVAQRYFVGLRTRNGWLGNNQLRTRFPTNDSRHVAELCKAMLYRHWQGEGVFQVQITALDPRPEKSQTDMFSEDEDNFRRLNQAMDLINQRFGEFTLAPPTCYTARTCPMSLHPPGNPTATARLSSIPGKRKKQINDP